MGDTHRCSVPTELVDPTDAWGHTVFFSGSFARLARFTSAAIIGDRQRFGRQDDGARGNSAGIPLLCLRSTGRRLKYAWGSVSPGTVTATVVLAAAGA